MKNQEKIMELVLDHSGNPRNYGVLELADITQEGGNPGCGDIIKIYLTVDTDGVVDEIKFSGEGCMISQAGASLMVEKMKGKSIEEIQAMSPDAVIDILGKKLVSTRPRCAMLGFNTIKNAIKEYKKQEMLSSI
jgi:nitrogen fixation NifU-like protein